MSAIKGPAIFLAQFLREEPPYNSIEAMGSWVAGLGYKGVQIPPRAQIGYDPAEDASRFTMTESGVVVIPKGYSFPD